MATRSRRPSKTPEEMEEIRLKIQAKKEKEKLEYGRSKVRNGRIIIWVISFFLCLAAMLEYYTILPDPIVFVIYAPVIIAFIAFGVFYYRNPFAFSIAALSLYGLLILVSGIVDPISIVKGLIIKGVIIVGLVRAIKYGKEYKEERKKSGTEDLLDADLL